MIMEKNIFFLNFNVHILPSEIIYGSRQKVNLNKYCAPNRSFFIENANTIDSKLKWNHSLFNWEFVRYSRRHMCAFIFTITNANGEKLTLFTYVSRFLFVSLILFCSVVRFLKSNKSCIILHNPLFRVDFFLGEILWSMNQLIWTMFVCGNDFSIVYINRWKLLFFLMSLRCLASTLNFNFLSAKKNFLFAVSRIKFSTVIHSMAD